MKTKKGKQTITVEVDWHFRVPSSIKNPKRTKEDLKEAIKETVQQFTEVRNIKVKGKV